MNNLFVKLQKNLICLSLIFSSVTAFAQSGEGLLFNVEEPEHIRDARMQWFRDAHFGMFVHWGLYSGAEGMWDGKDYGGCAEWIQHAANVPADIYASRLLPLFRPKKDFAREWARTAKEAGCRYVIFTSRHHEGFALHDSKVTSFDGKDVTGRDLFREIVGALHEQGLRVGVYFSLLDWHHPDAYVEHGLPAPGNVKNDERNNEKYKEYMYRQAEEIFSSYGPIDVVWWDYSSKEIQGEKWGATNLMTMVKKHHPNIVMNNRLYAVDRNDQYTRAHGDLVTPEQHIPESGFKGIDWESCMTMNGTWGYSRNNQNWSTSRQLIWNMIDIVSKGGNYLLNVGPMADGTIPSKSIELMQDVGRWMNVYGGSIYGTRANTLGKVAWGRITTRPGTYYLHVFHWPQNNRLLVPLQPSANTVTKAYFLADKQKVGLPVETARGGLYIDISKNTFKDDNATVIVLEAEGTSVADQGIFPAADGTYELEAAAADLKGDRVNVALVEKPYINTWIGRNSAEWILNIQKKGKYRIILEYACTDTSAGSSVNLQIRKATLRGAVKSTGGWESFRSWEMGTVTLAEGVNRLVIEGESKPSLGVMNLRSVKLVPIK
jgi:alpha-L-fucosidase